MAELSLDNLVRAAELMAKVIGDGPMLAEIRATDVTLTLFLALINAKNLPSDSSIIPPGVQLTASELCESGKLYCYDTHGNQIGVYELPPPSAHRNPKSNW